MRGYEALIETMGCEVIGSLYMGDYQGDILMIVRSDEGRFGVLVTGYGSCSGCDALEAVDGDPEATHDLAESLYNGVMWQEPDEIIEHLETKDWEASYYGSNEQIPGFIEQVKQDLILRYLGGF